MSDREIGWAIGTCASDASSRLASTTVCASLPSGQRSHVLQESQSQDGVSPFADECRLSLIQIRTSARDK